MLAFTATPIPAAAGLARPRTMNCCTLGLMEYFLTTGWPWTGLGIAAVLLTLLLFTGLYRSNTRLPRFQDLGWLAWLAIPLYQLHQFEEHGIDLLGRHYAFREAVCSLLGFPDIFTCPVPVSFITAVNLGTVWAGILLSASLGRRRPLVALSAYATPFVNGVIHTIPAIVRLQYNPGLGTAIVLFLPVSIWVFRTALRQRAVAFRGVARVVAAGVVLHIVMIGSLFAFIHGAIGEALLAVIQVVNGVVPAAFALW